MKTPYAFAVIACLLALGADDPESSKLSMRPAVACSKITGYGDYVPLNEPVLTRDDKLLVYYEPTGYTYEMVGKEYRVHLVQDGLIHRRGEKAILQSKEKLLDYVGKSKTPPFNNVFLSNTIALKSLPPGEYDLEIVLRDELSKGQVAKQLLKFRIKLPDETPEKP